MMMMESDTAARANHRTAKLDGSRWAIANLLKEPVPLSYSNTESPAIGLGLGLGGLAA